MGSAFPRQVLDFRSNGSAIEMPLVSQQGDWTQGRRDRYNLNFPVKPTRKFDDSELTRRFKKSWEGPRWSRNASLITK